MRFLIGFLIGMLLALSLAGCKKEPSEQELQSRIEYLKQEVEAATLKTAQVKDFLKAEIKQLQQQRQELFNDVELPKDVNVTRMKLEVLQRQVKELEKCKEVLTPKVYMLKLRLAQSHSVFDDLDQHIKDAMNAAEFELAVDRDLYESLEPKQDLFKAFRGGSFFISGTLGDWHITVLDKYTKPRIREAE